MYNLSLTTRTQLTAMQRVARKDSEALEIAAFA